jgi:hypothetical protein
MNHDRTLLKYVVYWLMVQSFRLREISVVFSKDYEPVGLKKTPK